MIFAADGRKIRHTFHRIMMRSAARLAYPQAQAAIDGTAGRRRPRRSSTRVLKPLWDAYAVLKRGRDKRQPLDLDLPERKILLKPDGTVDRVDRARAARRAQADRRVHDPGQCRGGRDAGGASARSWSTASMTRRRWPSRNRCASSCRRSACRWRAARRCRPASSTRILERVRGSDNEALVNEVVLRSQSQAIYSPDNIGHFGLNLRRYAHFTSPIRRYADLIVHRALISRARPRQGRADARRGRAARGHRRADLGHRAPRHGGRARHGRPADRRLSSPSSSTASFDARISGVTKAGLFVQLPQFGADGFIPVSTLGDDYYIYDETARALCRRAQRQRLPARRPRRGQAGRGRAAGRRDALRDAERAEAAAGIEAVVPQGEGARSARARSRSRGRGRREETMMDKQVFGGEHHTRPAGARRCGRP